MVSFKATTRPAPVMSGRYSSNAAMSNPMVVTAVNRSPSPSHQLDMAKRMFVKPSCLTATPFGAPDDPEV